MVDKAIYVMKAVPDDVANEVMDRTGGMRLNNAMKQQVVEKALVHGFTKREAELLKEEHAISKALFAFVFGVSSLFHLKKLGEPFVFMNQNSYGHANPAGTLVQWNVGGQYVQLHLKDIPVPRNFGARHQSDHGRKNPFNITMEKNAPLVERCRAWQDAGDKLRAEREKVCATLNAILQGISTYKSLEKNWPEGKQFYKHLPNTFPYRHQVPATLVGELNKSLGI